MSPRFEKINKTGSPSDRAQTLRDVPMCLEVPVNDAPENRTQYGIHGNVRRVQEGHDRTECRDAGVLSGCGELLMDVIDCRGKRLTIITGSDGRLNIGGQRTIAGGPSVRYGNEGRRGLPRPADVRRGNGTVVLHSPNYVESEGIDAEPRNLKKELNHRTGRIRENASTHGSGDMVGEEENGECTEEFAKIRATNNDL
jgi:hypothetical protein